MERDKLGKPAHLPKDDSDCVPSHGIFTIKYAKREIGIITITKKLAVFDFDHTIIDDNSDTAVTKLVCGSKITKEVKDLHRSDGWTAFMQEIFKLLYKSQVNELSICSLIRNLPPVQGMINLITELHDNLNYDIIIISDSNSYFIKVWLEAHNLESKILRVFTNPAYFENGLLLIKMFHFQETCKLSTKNLCKGMIMEDFINSQWENVNYEKIIYVGDGLNDFCPILRLNEGDLACVRDKYKCSEIIKQAKAGTYLDQNGSKYSVKADVCIWNSGNDILDFITSKPV